MKTMKCAVRMMAKDNVAFEIETNQLIASIINERANVLRAICEKMERASIARCAATIARCEAAKAVCVVTTASVVTTVVMPKVDMAVPCDLMMSRFEERMDAHDAVMDIMAKRRMSMMRTGWKLVAMIAVIAVITVYLLS